MTQQKYILITGATSGLGKAAAMHLAAEGAVVIAASRNAQKGETLLSDYRETYPKGKGRIELVACDLNSFDSISMACEEVAESYEHLDMIINNAGIMNFEFRESKNGIEETWQVNLLAPMLISHLLIHKFKNVLEPKLIFTTSGLHRGIIDFRRSRVAQEKIHRLQMLQPVQIGRDPDDPLAGATIG